MLASKFCVFTTNHILHNASKFPLPIQHLKCLDKTLRCNQSNKTNSNIQKSELNSYNACEQKARIEQCHEKQDPSQKCEEINTVSDYKEIRKRVNDLIGGITKFFSEEKQTIIESLKKEAKVDKYSTCRWLNNISDSIDQKLQQIIQLDPCFGSQIRITVLRFKDHARNTFIALHYELAPSVKQIESILEKIQNEITRCLQKAAIQTLLCRCEGSPSIFKKCLSDNVAETEKIIERTMEDAEKKLMKVKKLRDYMLKCHSDALNEETKYHLLEMQTLSRYLDDCLATLKGKRK